MAAIQERIGKDGNKSFRVLIRRKGQPLQTMTFPNKTLAKQWATKVEAEILQGKVFKTSPAKQKTVAEMIDRYIENVLPTKGISSQINQKLHLTWWKEKIGDLRLSELSRSIVIEKRDELAVATFRRHSKTKKYSPATVDRYVDALSSALTTAVYDWEWMNVHPLRGFQVKFNKDNARTRYLTNGEQVALWEACQQGFNPIIHDIILLAITTGMRKSEVRNLKWEHVKLENGWLYADATKNGEKRHVPLGAEGIAMLKRRHAKRDSENPWVFPSAKKEQPFDFDTLFDKVVAKAGLEDFHFHDLRHTAASYLAMGGASLLELQKILGHKSLDMVLRYAHLSKGHMESVPMKMAEYLKIPHVRE